MKKVAHTIFVSLALLIVMGHTIIVHHHHDEIAVIGGHDEQEQGQDHHSIFSFGDLDDDFIPSKVHHCLPDDMGVFPVQEITGYIHELSAIKNIPEYHFKNEFPPPDDHSYLLSLRGPPNV